MKACRQHTLTWTTLILISAFGAHPAWAADEQEGSFTVSPGKQFTISLDANPSTGHRWSMISALPGWLEFVGTDYVDTSGGLLGGGGMRSWTYSVQGIGSTKLVFLYIPPDPTQAPARIYTAHITSAANGGNSVACGFQPGDRIELVDDHPTRSTLTKGVTGTVVCIDSDDPEYPLLISWDNWHDNAQSTESQFEFCDLPPAADYPVDSLLWMSCAMIRPVSLPCRDGVCSPDICLGDAVVLVAEGEARHGWPGIVVGFQDDGYVVLFNNILFVIAIFPPPPPPWYEVAQASQGTGYPWDARVKTFGADTAIVQSEVVHKYVDCCGQLVLSSATQGIFTSEAGWSCDVNLDNTPFFGLTRRVRLQGLLARQTGGSRPYVVTKPLISLCEDAPDWTLCGGSMVAYGSESGFEDMLWQGAGISVCQYPADVVKLTSPYNGASSLSPADCIGITQPLSMPLKSVIQPPSTAMNLLTDCGTIKTFSHSCHQGSMLAFAADAAGQPQHYYDLFVGDWAGLQDESYFVGGFKGCYFDLGHDIRIPGCEWFYQAYTPVGGYLSEPWAAFPCDLKNRCPEQGPDPSPRPGPDPDPCSGTLPKITFTVGSNGTPIDLEPDAGNSYSACVDLELTLNFKGELSVKVEATSPAGGQWSGTLDPSIVGPGDVTTTLCITGTNLDISALCGGTTASVAKVRLFVVPAD